MDKKFENSKEHEFFVTEFPKENYGIVDYLQGRVHFALLDQIKLMSTSGMSKSQIKKIIISNVAEIIDNFETQKSKSS